MDETIEALKRIESYKDLFLVCKAIAPKSVAPLWSREILIEIISDVLASRE